jgi:hypothetical protein
MRNYNYWGDYANTQGLSRELNLRGAEFKNII